MKSKINGRFHLGPFEIASDMCTISKGGEEVKVTPKNMDVLIYMAENADRVISAAELLDRFWSPVTSDHAVHKAIADIRHAMGDSVRCQNYIKTLPKRGYKLLCRPIINSNEAQQGTRFAGFVSQLRQSVHLG